MRDLRPEVQAFLDRVSTFIDNEIRPNEATYAQQTEENGRWCVPPIMEEMKAKAKAEGLWNFFLPGYEGEFGTGLSNFEYSHLAEKMGAVGIASEVFNCSAPDTGNMEVLERYGTDEQKEQWLKPLLAGDVINGEKWWTSGAGDPRCKIIIFMCVTDQDPDSPRHKRHSQILVPTDAEGIETRKMMEVFGWDDAPHGHAHLKFTNVRVPKSNMILGEGRGFEIAQGRLGPGRIHHCMRAVGLGERALQMMCERSQNRVAFGKPLAQLGGNMDIIANSRIELNMARLLTLQAAHMMDTVGNKVAASEIAQIKVIVPNIVCDVIDRAIQMHGGAGVSQVFPLARMYAGMRTLRLADGPDEVHRRAVARHELGKYPT
jgi:acyl-CoA dehydrogenase